MNWKKYQHIERLATSSVDGILNGWVHIFPKLDGANASVTLEDGALRCYSRNGLLDPVHNLRGFFQHIHENGDKYLRYLTAHPSHILYGEWLVPHTIKAYQDDAWQKFYVFDIFDQDTGRYIPYEQYCDILQEIGITYIPLLYRLYNPTEEKVMKDIHDDVVTWLCDKGKGEGIVIKNYDYINKFGRVTWAKVVRQTPKRHSVHALEDHRIEHKFAETLTQELCDKEYHKILDERNSFESKDIFYLLETIYYTMITEELYDFIKKNKQPKIDFGILKRLITTKAKTYFPTLF